MQPSPETRFLFISGDNGDGDVDVCHVGNGPRGPANARLIAAAPELLEALEIAVQQLKDYGADGFASGADAAIAKAKGEA